MDYKNNKKQLKQRVYKNGTSQISYQKDPADANKKIAQQVLRKNSKERCKKTPCDYRQNASCRTLQKGQLDVG